MKKFMLSPAEIDENKTNYGKWGKLVRRREAEIAFSVLHGKKAGLVLELGAGNGEQSGWISMYCDRLICTEMHPKEEFLLKDLPNVEFAKMDAQDLSRIADQTIDLVFSSNMMEHIPDPDRCLRECCRVLKEGGVMLHIMPNRWWKFFYFWISIIKFQRPVVHGVSKSHWKEFVAFGADSWKKVFTRNGLHVEEMIGLPFYIGHGPTFIGLIKAGNLLGIPASYIYVTKKCAGNGAVPA